MSVVPIRSGAKAQGALFLDPAAMAEDCTLAMNLTKVGSFYGPVGSMALGAGLIVSDLVQPQYLPDQGAYGTVRGPALVLSHECDIDPDNVRPFNDNVLIAPIIKLDACINSMSSKFSSAEIRTFLMNVAGGNTTRLSFVPRYGDAAGPLYFGGLIDLNYLTSCGVAALIQAQPICSLSGYAISVIDRALQNHLFREKSDQAPLPH